MAKAAPKKTAPVPAAPTPDPEPQPAEAVDALASFSAEEPDFSADEAELGTEPTLYRWHLSRAVFRGAKREWETCTSYPAGAGVLTADVIRDDWGPGTYYAQLRPAAGSGVGHGGVAKTRTFTLAAPRGATAAPGAASSTESLLAKLLEAQQRGFDQLAATLAARPASPATDPNTMLDLALRMAERMTPKGRDSDPLEQVGRWFEMADRFRAGKDWTDLIGQGIETLRPLVDVAVTKFGGSPTPTPGAAPPAGANGAAPKQLEGSSMLQLANFLTTQVRYLIRKAQAKSSANLYAELLLDNLPAGVTPQQALDLVRRPDALDQLLGLLPAGDRAAVAAERAWFEELLRELTGFLEAAVAPAPGDNGGESGDTPAA